MNMLLGHFYIYEFVQNLLNKRANTVKLKKENINNEKKVA